jgi:hypothetical protein
VCICIQTDLGKALGTLSTSGQKNEAILVLLLLQIRTQPHLACVQLRKQFVEAWLALGMTVTDTETQPSGERPMKWLPACISHSNPINGAFGSG